MNSNGVSDTFFCIASFISVSPLLHQYCILPARPEVNCHCLTNSRGGRGYDCEGWEGGGYDCEGCEGGGYDCQECEGGGIIVRSGRESG